MKKLILLLFVCSSTLFANDAITESKLKAVTVYLDGAQITRNASVKMNSGTTEFTFGNLSPHIQESSIQISGLKAASILSINYGINYLSKNDYSDEIKKIKDSLTIYTDKIQFEDDLIAGYNEELQLIQNNRQLGSETQVVSLNQLQEFAAYYRQRLTAIKNDIYTSEKKKKTYLLSIHDLKKQLAEFNVDDKIETGEIKVKLNADQSTNLNLIIKYNVSNAGWFPIYDLKADKVNTPLQLAYKAHVYQKTGVDWSAIKLTLSTSDPNTNNIKPDINPKYLNFINRYSGYKNNRATRSYNYKYNPLVNTVSGTIIGDDGLPLPGVNVIVKGTSNGTQTDFDGNYSINVETGKALQFSYVGFQSEELPVHSSTMNLNMKEDLNALDEVVITAMGVKKEKSAIGYASRVQDMAKNEEWDNEPYTEQKDYTANGDIIEQGITNTRFEIKKQYSIPNDGDITVIEIENYTVPAEYAYFAAPVLNENVFLTAKIGNWEQYNLLPAEANVYFEGSYSGKTNINPQATTDSLTVSLGVDPNVVVKRNELTNFKKQTFIGSNKVVNRAYEIELKNNKLSNIDIVLYDRIPISQNKDIKVDAIETGTSDYDAKKGIMKWKLNIAAEASKTFKFSYSIKFPKRKRINL